MQEHNITPNDSLQERSKDTYFQNQFKITYEAFYVQPLTMKELSILKKIDRANICRYVRLMRRAGTIKVFSKGYCRITKHLANRYTTNPDLFPFDKQLKFFSDGE